MNNFMPSRLSALALCGAGLFTLSATASADFSGYYDVSNWQTQTNQDGFVDTSGAPSTITVVGTNDGSGNFGYTDFLIVAQQQSTVSFSWAFNSQDAAGFDSGLYFTSNTGFVTLSDTSGANGTVSVNVDAGDIIAFSAESTDSQFGRGYLTIRDFDVEAVPEPATMAVLGLGLAAAARRRRK